MTRRFCGAPFSCLEVVHGLASTCCCMWVDESTHVHWAGVPNPWQVWNAPGLVRLREAVLADDWLLCAGCPKVINGGQELTDLPDESCRPVMERGPRVLGFGTDETCNLHCWSCRPGPRPLDSDMAERAGELHAFATAFLSGASFASFTHRGDPFASPFYRRLLVSMDGADYPNLAIRLFTNGQLLVRYWPHLHKIHANVRHLWLSIDAANAETYQHVRPGGSWRAVLSALRLGRELRQAGKLVDFQLNFVVRASNFRDMPAFVALAKEHSADVVWFSLLRRTWQGRSEFLEESLANEGHPDRAEFLCLIEDPMFRQPPVVTGSFLPPVHSLIAADVDR